MSIGVVIPAAGLGRRMGSGESKQFMFFNHQPIFIHTLHIFESHPQISEIVVVVGEEEIERTRAWIVNSNLHKVKHVVAGGEERQDSVFEGLKYSSTQWVLVHDAVRPFVTEKEISDLLSVVQEHRAATLAVPVKNTIKMVDVDGTIEKTLDRGQLWEIHTPQAFCRNLLIEAHTRAVKESVSATDDAMLVEHLGIPVKIVAGEYTNIKITTPEDLFFAQAIDQMRQGMKYV